MPTIKGVCLDLDNTLANTEDLTISNVKKKGLDEKMSVEYKLYQYLSEYIRSVDWATFIAKYEEAKDIAKENLSGTAASHNRYLYIQRTLEMLGARFNPALVYEAANFYWQYIIDSMQLYPGVEDTLRLLKENNVKISIITDLSAEVQNMKFIKLGINKYIDYLVTAEEAGADKPDVKQVDLALQKMNLKEDEVVIIGNNPKTDIQVAINKSMKSVLFDYDGLYQDRVSEFDYYINDFSAIQIILGLEKKISSDEKLVVFDLVGTMTNERHLVSNILANILNMDKESIRKQYELYKVGAIKEQDFWESLGISDYASKITTIISQLGINNEILTEVMNLKQKGFKLAVLSNIPSEWGYEFISKYELGPIFEKKLFSGDLGMKKPDPKIYEYLLNLYPNINPANIYFVDDDLEDLSAGKNYLMQTVWIKNGESTYPYVPDYVVNTPNELGNVIA